MVNILITDSVFPKNAGDAAILLGMLEDLESVFPKAEITVLSKYPDAARSRLSYTVLPGLFDDVRGWLGKGYPFDLPEIARSVYHASRKELQKSGLNESVLEAYQDADIVISCGGGFINDYYNVYKVFSGYYVAFCFGKPLVIYAQSIGPFEKFVRRSLARLILNKFSLIVTRDSRSEEILRRLGVDKPRIVVGSDAGLNLPVADTKRLTALLKSLGLDPSEDYIGISVRKWIYPGHSNPRRLHRKYICELAKMADDFIRNCDARVVFVSTCNEEDYGFNDPKVADEIIKQMRHPERTVNVRGVYDPRDIKAVMAIMRICICTRMHALMFSTTMGVPSIGIEYEFKTREYLKALGLEKYVVRIDEISHNTLLELTDSLLSQYDAIRNRMKAKIQALQSKNKAATRLLASLI